MRKRCPSGIPWFVVVTMLPTILLPSMLLGSITNADEPYRHAEKIDELALSLVEPGVVHGVSVGLIDHDRTWVRSYGTLAESKNSAPNENTIYEIGSISKVFTGILLASAVQAGEVTLDSTIGSIAAPLRQSNPKLANSIQLRHLATHASGLPRMPDNWVTIQPVEIDLG